MARLPIGTSPASMLAWIGDGFVPGGGVVVREVANARPSRSGVIIRMSIRTALAFEAGPGTKRSSGAFAGSGV